MLSILLGALLLGPPAPDPTDESGLYEVEPVPVPGTLEPIEITPPPPRPTLVPSPSEPVAFQPPLPTPNLTFDLPPPPPPPTGAGRLVGGSFAIGLGLAAASVVIVEVARSGSDGNPQFVSATFIPIGLTSIGIGTYLLVRGAKARANFNEWRAFTRAESKPTGEGLLVAGTMSSVIGGVTLLAASVQARDPDAFDHLLAPSLFAVAGAGIGVGVGTLTAGFMRRNRYRTWRQSTFLSAVPVVAPLRGGLGFGVVGRF